jgi:alpha-tubulin suppressor-like RCC1 family protein
MKQITFRGLLVVGIVFFINGCGGGGSSDNLSSSNSKNGNFSLTLDVDEITVVTDWKNSFKSDGVNLDIVQNGKYGKFSVEDRQLSYLKTVETNQSDSGQFEIEMEDGILVPITVTINSLYWKEAKCGAHHTIALKSDGTIWSWGYNQNGELGDGTNIDRLSAVQETTKSIEWRTLDAGGWFNLAIKQDNTLWAWGHNDMAQFGDGSDIFTHSSSTTPIKVSSVKQWSKISAGQNHVLALQYDFTLWAWGSNGEGQVGNGDTSMVHTPYKIDGNWHTISAGENYSMAIKSDNTLWGWGENGFGQLGINSTTSKKTPIEVSGSGWSSLATGDYHTLSVKDGKLFGWGMNGFGELTNNSDGTDEIHQPKEINFERVKKICAGANYSLVIREDKTLWGWGNNQYAQLGIDNWNDTKTPTQEATKSSNWVDVDCGTIHSVAIRDDGTLWIWGSNQYGELGIGTLDSKAVPTHILGRNL